MWRGSAAIVLELEEIGFALAMTLDAVRIVPVPGFMRLQGEWNRWLPLRPA